MFKECDKTSVSIFLSVVLPGLSLISDFILLAVFIDAPQIMILSPRGHFCILSSKPTKWHQSYGLLRLPCFSVFHPRAANFQQCEFLIFLINYSDIHCVYSDLSVLCINQHIPISFSSLVFACWFSFGGRKPRGNIISFFQQLKENCTERGIWSAPAPSSQPASAAWTLQHVTSGNGSILLLMLINFR